MSGWNSNCKMRRDSPLERKIVALAVVSGFEGDVDEIVKFHFLDNVELCQVYRVLRISAVKKRR
jgi:hypothetical protein